jgi:hypothetical protein
MPMARRYSRRRLSRGQTRSSRCSIPGCPDPSVARCRQRDEPRVWNRAGTDCRQFARHREASGRDTALPPHGYGCVRTGCVHATCASLAPRRGCPRRARRSRRPHHSPPVPGGNPGPAAPGLTIRDALVHGSSPGARCRETAANPPGHPDHAVTRAPRHGCRATWRARRVSSAPRTWDAAPAPQ